MILFSFIIKDKELFVKDFIVFEDQLKLDKFKTDITGQYRFTNICAGTYMILVNHASCDSIKLQLSIQKNQIKNFSKINGTFDTKKDIQSNWIITNSSGPAIFVRYNRGLL